MDGKITQRLAAILPLAALSREKNKLSVALAAMEERDRRALYGLILLVTGLLIYFALWSPLETYQAQSRLDRDRQLELLQWMKSTEPLARQSRQNNVVSLSGQTLLTQISASAQRFGITPSRIQPEGDERVSIWFDEVPFNELIKWLQSLDSDGQIRVRQITVDRGSQSGGVNSRMVLSS